MSAVENGKATLEDGKIILIGGTTSVMAPDSNAAEIAVGDYIQGYGENPDANEVNASSYPHHCTVKIVGTVALMRYAPFQIDKQNNKTCHQEGSIVSVKPWTHRA